MPSLRHELLAVGVPVLRTSRELDDEDRERARIEQWHATMPRTLPTNAVIRFHRRYEVSSSRIGPGDAFPLYAVRARGARPTRTVLYLHGGCFVAPIDPFHVRYAARLASALDAEVLLPD